MKGSCRRMRGIVAVLLLALAGAAGLALAAAPARAYDGWQHDGASTCASCHTGAPPTNATCTACHAGFKVQAGYDCWSCHAPGQDTAALSSPASACTQGCHLWDRPVKLYDIPYSHGPSPHLGASGFGKTCLDCHPTSGASPHHTGVQLAAPTCQDCHNGSLASAQVSHDGVDCTACHSGMNIPPVPATCNKCHAQKTFGTANCAACHAGLIHNTKPKVDTCTTCHSGYQKHAGKVACTRCHTNAPAVHHVNAKIKAKGCVTCHKKKHAGRRVAAGKCRVCHKGNAPASKPRVQHSSRITKKYLCGTCHSKALHASARGASLTCRSCHGGKFHRVMPRSTGVCLRCHTAARAHAVGYSCSICHRSAIHNARPRA